MSGKSVDLNKNGKGNKLIKEKIHDPYMARCKPTEPTVCSECGVVFSSGRWQWMENAPDNPKMILCPACQRIHDRVPAGYLTLQGSFYNEHKEEIAKLIQNHADRQEQDHPLKRLMKIEDQKDNSTLVTVTEHHLATSLGKAIESAFQGDLDIQYTDEDTIVRVYWVR